MKMKNYLIAITVSMALSGCVTDGDVSEVRKSYYEPGIAEREGLALSRIVTSPYSIVGFTYADCKRAGAWAPLLFHFDLLKTVPAGCLAASADILTGTTELLTFHQFKDVSYPWESFDKEKSDKWGKPVLVVYACALAGAAEGLANSSGSYSTTYSSTTTTTSSDGSSSSGGYKPKPRVKHSYCHGTGRCQICHGNGKVGAGKRCVCGGSGRCSACGGTGYAN